MDPQQIEYSVELEAHGRTLREIALRLSMKFWRGERGGYFENLPSQTQATHVVETARHFHDFLQEPST